MRSIRRGPLQLSIRAPTHQAVKSKSLWPTLRVIILDAALQWGAKAKGLFKCQ